MSLETFTRQYIKTALWSSHDDNGTPLDKDHSARDINEVTLAQMKEDASLFYFWYSSLFGADDSKAGHDFWLTRNGHGAGFWDGDWPKEIGEFLTKASEKFGEYDLSVGDDGKIFAFVPSYRPTRLFFDPPPHPAHEGGVLDWFPKDKRSKKKGPEMGIGLPQKKFGSPTFVMTPGAEDAIGMAEEAEEEAGRSFSFSSYLDRHFSGDWGEIGKEDAAQNDAMISEKGMILSAYTLPTGTKIWIITDPGHKVTTALLPSEY